MTIPKLTPYTGQVANPDGSQTQTEFTQNMFDQLSYEAQLATQLDATIDGMNNAVDEVEANAISAQNSANAAEAAASSAGYQGLWPDTGGSALKGEIWQTQVGGTPTGEYYTALQDTSVNPVGDDVNWKIAGNIGQQNISDYTDIVYSNVADMIAGASVAARLGGKVSTKGYYLDGDNGGANYIISSVQPSEVGLINHQLNNGLYAVFAPEEDSKIKARQAGAKFDGITDDFPSFEAIKDAGFRRVVLGIGETKWSGRLVYQDFNNLEFVGAGNTKFIEVGGYQPHITQITPTFDSTEPLIDIRGGVNNKVKHLSLIANQGARNSYSGAALRHYAGSYSLSEKVTSSGFKLGQILEGHIYGVQRNCFSEGGADGFAYEGIGGVSQTNTCEVYGCRVRQVHTGFAVNSCTGLNLHSPKGEIISDQFTSDRATGSGLILDANNKNLSITGTAYLEGGDQFWQAPQTNPSVGTVINDFYYRNPENYVLSGLKQDFGILGAGTKILSGYIAETTNYSGTGLPTDVIGRIRSKDRCQITGVVGGFIEIEATSEPHTIVIGGNNLGVDRFEGVFYLSGADTSKLYSNITRKRYHSGNLQITLNASGYAEINTGLGANKVGSLDIRAYITQGTNGDVVTSFQDGTETVRLYVRTAAGALVTSTTRRINLTVNVVANF